MVPKNLTTGQKASQRDVCLDLLDRLERHSEFVSRVVTGDESWSTTPRRHSEFGSWHSANSPRPKKARISKSKFKSMLICFFDSQGFVHKEFVPPGQTVNQTFYREVLDSGKGWHVCDQALHALGCRTTTTPHVKRQSPSMNFWQKKSIPLIPQPPYSPDLSSCDFFLFPRLKNHFKGAPFWYFG